MTSEACTIYQGKAPNKIKRFCCSSTAGWSQVADASLDPVSMLMVEAKLQAQPISTADAANGANLLSSLLNRKTRVEPTRDYKSVFEFLTYFLDLYRKRKLSSIADQQLLMKHLAQASTDLNRILYPEESKRCYRCAAVKARAESSCLHGVCLCGSCVFLKDNVCRQCPWPGNSFKAIK